MDIEKAKYFIQKHAKSLDSLEFIIDFLSIDDEFCSVLNDIDVIHDIISSQVSNINIKQKVLDSNTISYFSYFTDRVVSKNKNNLNVDRLISYIDYDLLTKFLLKEKNIQEQELFGNTTNTNIQAGLLFKLVKNNTYFCNQIMNNLVYKTNKKNSKLIKDFLLNTTIARTGVAFKRNASKDKSSKYILKNKHSLLHWCFESNNFFICDLLLDLGKDIEEADYENNTIGFFADTKEQFDYLIDKKVNWMHVNNTYEMLKQDIVSNFSHSEDIEFNLTERNIDQYPELRSVFNRFVLRKSFIEDSLENFIDYIDRNKIDMNSHIGLFHFSTGISFYSTDLPLTYVSKIAAMLDRGMDLTQKNPVDGSMLAHSILFNLHVFSQTSDQAKEISKTGILDKIFNHLDKAGIFEDQEIVQEFYDKIYQTSILNALAQSKFGNDNSDIDLIFKEKSGGEYVLKDIFNSYFSLENLNLFFKEEEDKYLDKTSKAGLYSKQIYPHSFYNNNIFSNESNNPVNVFYMQSNNLLSFLLENNKFLPEMFKYHWNFFMINKSKEDLTISPDNIYVFNRALNKKNHAEILSMKKIKEIQYFYKMMDKLNNIEKIPYNIYNKNKEPEYITDNILAFFEELNDWGLQEKTDFNYLILNSLKKQEEILNKGSKKQLKKICGVNQYKTMDKSEEERLELVGILVKKIIVGIERKLIKKISNNSKKVNKKNIL